MFSYGINTHDLCYVESRKLSKGMHSLLINSKIQSYLTLYDQKKYIGSRHREPLSTRPTRFENRFVSIRLRTWIKF